MPIPTNMNRIGGAHLECGRSWVCATIGSNQRL